MSSFRIIKHSTARYMLIALLLALFMSLILMSCGSSGDSSDKHVHTYSSAWSRDAKDHWHAATCGHDVVSDKAAHTYGNWTVVTAATATRDGLRRKTCSVCRYAQEEVIPKTGPEASGAEALNGVFSVSSSGKEVSFSKGNLYYTGSVWKFENNQYDFRTWSGKDAVVNGVYSSTGTPSGNVGLFYWSKNKKIAIAETYNDPGRSADDTFFVNTDSSVAGADWIALSSSEWDYLLNTRSNASSKRGLASINTGSTSVKGLVLLPDSWTLPNGCTFTGADGSYSTNSYTKAQWTAMEAAGAVFFPASGIRAGSSAEYVQSDGYYGSSTPSADKDYANEMGFYIGLIGTDSYDRIYGGSIRPVVSKSHTHTYSSEWTSDADYHWHASTCGHDVVSDKAAHTYGNWTTITDATTTSTGLCEHACTVCGYVQTMVIPIVILDHTHTYASAWSSDTSYHWHASTCGHDVTSDRGAHTWNSGTVTTSATHIASGVKTYTCTVCGKSKTETIPAQADAHTYATAWTSDADYHWHASTCGHDVVSDKAAHTYGNWTTVTDATTSSTGLICTSCTVCGYVLEEVIPVVIPDHTHTYSSAWSSDTNFHWHASTCGHEVTKDKAAHSWNSGVVTTSATHTANGVKTYTCTVCGKTKTENIPAQTDAHTYATAWTSDADYHWHASTCGHDVTTGTSAHSFGEWEIITEPTASVEGLKRRTCSVCGYAENASIPRMLIISFNANGGSGIMTSQTVYNSVDTSLTSNAFTRTGYVFTGWNTSSNGTGTFYADGGVVNLTDGIRLYAQWEVISSPEPLCGVFTVSSSGKMVKFSRGNLYYTGSSWDFEDYQYDFRTWQGNASVKNGAYSSTGTASGNTGLFYWSKDTDKAVAATYDSMGESASDVFFLDSNPVMGSNWFTLSYDEWRYLIYSRTNAPSKSGLATINTGFYEVKGLVLLPDSWTLPAGCLFTSWFRDYETNSYTASQWAAMESAGAVFLPATGIRKGNSIKAVQSSSGDYWSCTPDSHYVNKLEFGYWSVSVDTGCYRGTGCSVRLVTLVDPEETVSVTFNANGGSGTMVSQTVCKSVDASLVSNAFTRTGYVFTGWNTSSNGTGTSYVDGGIVNLTESITLYAQWEWGVISSPEPLCGVFTVSSSGKTVKFSRGNLYYTGSFWGFEDNQYDFRTWQGSPAVKNGAYSEMGTAHGNVGLFYWSKDTDKAVAATYGPINYSELSTTDVFFLDSNPVMGSNWFTLSYDEWRYLIYSRTNAPSKSGLATINTGFYEVKGLVLLPDYSWMLPAGCSFIGGDGSGYATNTYTASQWAAMEAAGAVFFPAAGLRQGGSCSVDDVQEYGYYWSSTPDSSSSLGAGDMYFSSDTIIYPDRGNRDRGSSVRLVTLGPVETFSITFNANGGSGTMMSQTVYKSVDTTLNYNVFTRSDYVFTGWNTSLNGTGTYYADGGAVKNLTESITLYARWKPVPDALSGVFTVSSSGKKVKFSRGNLYYTGSSWGFEDNQYDFRTWQGSRAVRDCWSSSTRMGNTGLFYWSKDTDKAVADLYNSTGRSISDVFFLDSNPVMGSDWFTLSYDEWKYLLYNRTNASSKKGLAKVGTFGVKGLVLLPDSWVLPVGCSFISGYGSGYETNTYTESQWAAMEAGGAVFLPASGVRDGRSIEGGSCSVDDVQEYGDYWSSTPDLSSEDAAGNLYFFKDDIAMDHKDGNRCFGISVRLVTLSQN